MTLDEILEQEGWSMDCESPLELSHEDGSFASGQAAQIVIDSLKKGRKRNERKHNEIDG